jgi:four helix bundle protein
MKKTKIKNRGTRHQLAHHSLLVWHRATELVRLVAERPINDRELRNQAARAAKSVALNIAEGAGLEGAERPINDRELRNQAARAAKSVALNIAEGAGLEGAASGRHFRIARGSACEVAAAYEIAEALGHGDPSSIAARCNQLAAMLTGLMRR